MTLVGINGFGRIGKCCLLQLIDDTDVEIKCINSTNLLIHEIEDYLMYDSTHKLYNRNFTSILCGGLGMGVVPFLVQPFCNKVDVVELDSEVIDLINNKTNYLDPKVNIIQGDIMTHTTDQKYDVILIDIWVNDIDIFNQQKPILEAKYAANLNPGGLLYFPLADRLS